MAGNVDRVQLQVEVVRNQLDTLIKDVNSLKGQKLSISVESSGMEAINKFNASIRTLEQNVGGLNGKFTKIWDGVADGAPARTIETVNNGLGRTTEIIRTLDEETQSYTTVQTKTTANYDKMAQAAQKAAEQAEKLRQQQEGNMWRSYNAELENQQRILSETDRAWAEYAKQQADAEQQIAESTKKEVAWYDSWLDGQDKIFESAQKNMPTLQKQYADLARSIESATAKYPEGTFDRLSGEVSSVRESLRALDSGLADGTVSYEDYVRGVDEAKTGLKGLQSEFSQTQADTEKLKNSTNILGDSLTNIVKKIVAWQVINASVAKVIGMFREAVSTLKEVDTELTAIQKVTNNTDAEMAKLSEHAYEVASQYGVAVTDYLESTGTFAKAGYKELSEDMAELATKTQLVGDVNAETANQFLLSADAAYKMEGNVTRLSTVLDKANVIENNYATSIQKMAEGFPIVANVASMANMDIDELMAGLGTITAVTQESGTKAATALRALILNIMGDTKTEIADGVSWTKEEVESLSDALWVYAEDAMKAAQASGTLVDPMEAIASLAKAYKDGLLTQAELAQIESDLGGKLRTNQLDALIKNYDMYAEMLDKVADSAGSADQEVEIMLSSWESKTNILQNKWTEFISHLVDTDTVKGGIDILTDAVEVLDSDFGHVIVTAGGVITSLYGIATAAGAIKKASAAFNLASLNPWVIAIAGVAAVIGIAAEATKNLRKSYEELDAEIAENTNQIEKNKQKIEEINNLSWDEKTASILAERDALAKENKELERQNELLNERKKRKAEDELSGANRVVTDENSNNFVVLSGNSYYDTLIDDLKRYGEEMRTTGQISEDNIQAFEQARTEAGKLAAAIELLGYDSEEVTDKQREMYDAFMGMEAEQEKITASTQNSAEATQDATDAVSEYADAAGEAAENQKTLAEQMQGAAKALTSQKNDLKTANAALDEYQRVGKITASTLQSLLGMSEGYINVLIDENGKLKITQDTLRDLVSAIYGDIEATNDQISVTDDANVSAEAFVSSLMDEAKQSAKTGQAVRELVLEEIKLNSTNLNLEQQIAAVVALGQAAGATAASIAMLSAYGGTSASNAERTISGYLQTGQAKTRAEAEAKYLQNLYNQLDFSKTDTSTSTSGGGGSGTDARLEALKDRVSLLKSELTLMEKQGKSADEQKAKMKEIQQALHAQAQYLRSIGGNETDINDLSAEWWDWQKKINGELEDSADLLDELKNALQDALNRQQDARDAELKAIDDQIDALKKQKDEKDKQVELEEKLLAIQQAEAALAVAQTERTVRQYNSSSGQWEWVANQKDIDDAQEALDKARKDLEDFQDQAAYDARLAELEAQKDAINAKYDALEAQYDRFLDSLKEKTRGIGEILQDILKNATPELRQIILENAELFKSFGIDVSELLNSFTETVKKIVRVLPGGKAPAGLNVGDQVVTGGGTFEITGVNPDGSYESKKVDPNQTIYNYTGPYDDVPGGYTGPNQYPSGGGSSGSRGGRTVRVESGTGKAPKGLSVGDKVVTAVGTYIITAVNPDGSYQSQMYDKNQTIYNFRGTYDAYDNGGILHGMGAIKATGRDEFVADPDTTELLKRRFGNWKALSPARDTQSDSIMHGIRMTLGAQNGANAANSYSSNSIGTQYNGPLYQLGGVTITEREAQTMTVKKLADAARTLVIKAQA